MLRRSTDPVYLRFELVRYAREHGIKPAARQFSTTVKTVRKWLRRWEPGSLRGLADRSRAPLHPRQGIADAQRRRAVALADELKEQYPDAQIYLDLKGVSEQPLSPAEVLWYVISSFHPDMKRPDDGELPTWYRDLLNRHRALIVYDNAKDGPQIEPLLPPEHCLLLVTSRRHFKVPGMFNKDLDEMTGVDATDLLLEIAPRIASDAAAIAKQCGYLPLALRLAASALHKSHALSPSDLLRRLQDKRKRVELVEASFSLSYGLLSEELQQRWRMLAIFPIDFDAPAAAAVWETDVDAAKDSLAEFEEYSLLDWAGATRRYTLHDLAREFADTRLSTTEREQAGLLHAAHYLQILSRANSLFLKGGEAIAEGLSDFDSEFVNIEAGQEWAAARFANDKQAAHLCNEYPSAGGHILRVRQHPRDFIRWPDLHCHLRSNLKIKLLKEDTWATWGMPTILWVRRGALLSFSSSS
jgi:transposase-like protein